MGWSGIGRETLVEVWDGLGRFGTGRETLKEVCDWSGDPRGGPGRVEGHSGRSRAYLGTLGEVQEG